MLDTTAVTGKVKELNEANAKGRTEVSFGFLLRATHDLPS